MPGYLTDIQLWSPSNPIADTFTPLAYPLFLAPAFRLAGLHGVLAMQALLYLAIVALAFDILQRLALPPRVAAFATLPILMHPEFLLSLNKIWDVALSTALFLFLVGLALRIQRTTLTPGLTLGLGVALGSAFFCRPNFFLLLPAILFAVPRASSRISVLRIAAAGAIASLTFALAGVAAHGRPFVPRNGPYNLYAGANPGSAHALLTDLNAESSIFPALRDAHPNLIPPDAPHSAYFSPALEPIYDRDALHFLFHHPGQDVRLLALKLFTLFRPDTKVHPLHSAPGVLKAILALPALCYLFALLLPGRPALTPIDRLLLAFVFAYILPFLLTNADPRFRTPLDALLLLHTARLLWRRLGAAGGQYRGIYDTPDLTLSKSGPKIR
jgi:hypothetical protein